MMVESGDSRLYDYLLLQISVAVQRGIAAALTSRIPRMILAFLHIRIDEEGEEFVILFCVVAANFNVIVVLV